MTLKRYLFESNLHGTATVTQLGNDGQPWVRLDQTWFHPQGGGQKADRGTINGLSVIHVAHAGDEVHHYLEGPVNFQIGQEVTLLVDEEWRHIHTSLHTAGHLIAAVGEYLFPSIKPQSGHHWPGEARVEFAGEMLLHPEEVEPAFSDVLAKAIENDLPVQIAGESFASRVIQIGEFPPLPCGGTHLRRLGLLSKIELTKLKVKDGKLRVSYQT